jgi:hypothetical protein
MQNLCNNYIILYSDTLYEGSHSILKFEATFLNKNYEDDWLIDKSNGNYPFSVNLDYMHQDDLKAIWICYECKMIFAFHSDINDHKDLTGHKMIEKVMTISPSETLA